MCDNGRTYIVTVNGNGEFTPARDTQSTVVLVPLAFGDFTGTVTYPDGSTETISEPGIAKGQSGKRKTDTVTCTGDEDGVHFEAGGSVTGFVTPRGA